MILEEIKQSIEKVTGKDFKDRTWNLKYFCGLAIKHDIVSQGDIAEYLNMSRSHVSYCIKRHTSLSKNIGYNKMFKQIESDLIQRCE
ncbi:hypothetical protein RCZ04_04200 [Capnocytophaga sp. HP1101]